MITKIYIEDVATFKGEPVIIENLDKVNFFFGTNGSGKTTISRIINDVNNFNKCHLEWKDTIKLEPFVYNRDFIDTNFKVQKMKGVFTLGKTDISILENISQLNEEIVKIQGKLSSLNIQLNDSNNPESNYYRSARHYENYKEKFWKEKSKLDSIFDDALIGFKQKESFMNRLLKEHIENKEDTFNINDLQLKAKKIFVKELPILSRLEFYNYGTIQEIEENEIFQKKIVNSSDIELSKLINKYGISDWVYNGISHLHKIGNTCPFCQQNLSNDLISKLNNIFDQEYAKQNLIIQQSLEKYKIEFSQVSNILNILLLDTSANIYKEEIKTKFDQLNLIFKSNLELIIQKINEPSKQISLISSNSLLIEIEQIINSINSTIEENNKISLNLKDEKRKLTNQIWKYIVSQTINIINNYLDEQKTLNKEKSGLQSKILSFEETLAGKRAELRTLESSITGIEQTCDDINNTLKVFGYGGFYLVVSSDKMSYRIVRDNQTDATNLSEGEITFITFLYFFHLIKGSHSKTGTMTDRIIVFDDPVSSLDTNVLFIVNTLISELYNEVKDKSSFIKQLFILTHNLFFFKEITFNIDKKFKPNTYTFWIIRKLGESAISSVKNYEENPIKSSYQLLWEELKTGNNSGVLIQNTMRRILEYYFKILGDTSLDKLHEKFDSLEDKRKCKVLCSWMNDGSHTVLFDEFHAPLSDESIESYKQIFKEIFKKKNQIEHYNMMMNDESSTSIQIN